MHYAGWLDWGRGGRRSQPMAVAVYLMVGVVFSCGLFFTSSVRAAGERILYVEGDHHFPPYEFVDGSNQPKGWNVELFHAVAEAAGLKYEIHLVPWNQAREDIEKGRVDVLVGMYVSEERRVLVDFSTPHLCIHHSMFVRKSSNIARLEDLNGADVVVQNGDIMHDFVVQKKLGEHRLVTVETPAEGLRMLSEGKADVMLMGKLQGIHLLQKMGLENLVAVGPLLEPRQYAFAVRKGDEKLVAAINEGLRIVKETGQYDALYAKWFGTVENDTWSQREIGMVVGWVVGPACAAIVLAMAWNQGLRRQVRRKTAALEIELIARAQAEEQLQQLAAKLRNTVMHRTAECNAASGELEGFCHAIAHDLRAPLRAINGYASMLSEECQSPESPSCKQYLERIGRAAAHMGDLIDSLLALSRLTRTGMTMTDVDMTALAKSIVAELREEYGSRQVEVSVQEGMAAYGDANLLEVALRHLLDNAWKFTSKKNVAEIRVSCECVAGERIFSVADNGVGFDMSHVTNLFRPFSRLHAVGEFEGNAMGLATVDRIIHRHGGRVWAQGRAGQGATFLFALREEDGVGEEDGPCLTVAEEPVVVGEAGNDRTA